jgi:hypothetical protein
MALHLRLYLVAIGSRRPDAISLVIASAPGRRFRAGSRDPARGCPLVERSSGHLAQALAKLVQRWIVLRSMRRNASPSSWAGPGSGYDSNLLSHLCPDTVPLSPALTAAAPLRLTPQTYAATQR